MLLWVNVSFINTSSCWWHTVFNVQLCIYIPARSKIITYQIWSSAYLCLCFTILMIDRINYQTNAFAVFCSGIPPWEEGNRGPLYNRCFSPCHQQLDHHWRQPGQACVSWHCAEEHPRACAISTVLPPHRHALSEGTWSAIVTWPCTIHHYHAIIKQNGKCSLLNCRIKTYCCITDSFLWIPGSIVLGFQLFLLFYMPV